MDHAVADSDDDASVSTERLVQFAFVPRILAYLSRLDITNRITFSKRTVVSAGAFGDISIGKCNIKRRRKVKVAVKRLRLHLKEDIKLLLEKEVYVWSKLAHDNVLPLLGYAFDEDTGYPMLISEWMANGTAWMYVTKNPECDLIRLITGIARGLVYMHENDVIHSDIKADNVIVSNSGDALICDFGFARILNASRSLGSMSVGGEGTPQYMAYELLAHPETYKNPTKETDVWAFGVTIYELYTRKRPYEEFSRHQVPFRIMQGELLEFPDVPVDPHTTELTELLKLVCARCWILEPSKRARVTELVNVLERDEPRRELHPIVPTYEEPSFDSPMRVGTPANAKRFTDSDPSEVDSSSLAVYNDTHRVKRAKYTHSGDESLIHLPPLTTTTSSISPSPLSGLTPRDNQAPNTPSGRGTSKSYSLVMPPSNVEASDNALARKVKPIVRKPLGGYVLSSGHNPYSDSGLPSAITVAPGSSSLPPLGSSGGPTPYPPISAPPPPSSGSGTFLDDLNLDTLAPDYKKEGGDWFAVYNPKLKRALDVNLMHVLVHESVVCCVRFSADGKYLATGCKRTAQIYDTKTGVKICVLNDENASPVGDLYIRSVCFSPDGKLLATGAEDKTIRIWEISKKRVKRVFEGHQQEIYSLDFSKNGRLIMSGSGDRTARIWDMETGMQKVLEIKEPDGVDAGVTSVAISPDGRLVAAGSLDTVVRIWEVQSGNLIEKLLGHRDSVYSVAFTPDGKGIVSGSLDKTLKHWDISGLLGKKEGGVPSPTSSVGPGNGASGSGSGAVTRAKDANGGGERGSVNTLNFTGHKDYVLSVAVSHDGQWVVSGSKDRGVQFWEARTAQVQLMLQGHKNSVISIDLSPSGGVLATGSGDMQARLWSYKTI